MKLKLLASALMCGATMAHAQVQYSGPATPGHVPSNVTNSVIQDAGPATAPNVTEFGVHKNGGLPLCVTDQDSPPPFQDPYAQLCLAISPNAAQIVINSSSGPAPPLTVVTNGVSVPINGGPAVPPPFYDNEFTALTDADAAAATAGSPLIITKNWTLTAATILNAPTLIPFGGVIAMNGNNLTINGQISGPATQLINVGAFGASGTLTINGGKSIVGNWLCGPWGVSTVDYSPCIQAGFNIVFRNSQTPGPRLFDLESFGSQGAGGIFLNEGLTMNAAYEGIVYDPGMSWVMKPHNTMFYAITTATSGNQDTAGWSFIGSPYTTYGWATPVVSIDTQSVVFGFFAGNTTADGNHNIVIDGALMQNGFSFMSTEGSVNGFNGWWSSSVRNIYASGVIGPVIFHNPPTGGSERQDYFNILAINNTSTSWPSGLQGQVFVFNAIGGLTLNSWSVDGYGSAGTPVPKPFISLGNVQSCNLNNGHLEQNTIGLNFQAMITFTQSSCRVTGLFATATHAAASTNNAIIEASANSLVSIDDVKISNNTVAAGGTLYGILPGSDNTSQIKVGPLWTQDATYTGMFNTFLGSGTEFPQQIGYTFETALPPLSTGAVTGSAETDMGVGSSTIAGTVAPQGCVLTRALFQIPAAYTAGSVTVRFYNGATLLTSATIAPANGTSGYLFVSPPYGASALKIPGGGLLRITYQNSGATPAATLQVQASCLAIGN